MNIRNSILSLTGLFLCLGGLPEAHAQTVTVKLYLVSLLEGSQFLAPATLQLKAFASDPDGIQKVEFYSGTTLLGTGTLNGLIYTLNVPNVGVGTYSITAKSTDNTGKTKVTAATNITVKTGKVYGAPEAITPVPLYTSSSPYGYNEYLPRGYDSNDTVKKWPLVISLHGAGGQPGFNTATGEMNTQNLNQAVEGVLVAVVMDGINLPAVVLHPQADSSANGWGYVDAFITYALAHYNVDPDRVYLTGHSWGANIGALTYAGGGTNTAPNAKRLAALFTMCGGQFSASQTKGTRMAHVPFWNFASWGDQGGGGSIGTINALNYAAGATPYKDVIATPSLPVTLPDLLFSFPGYEIINNSPAVPANEVALTPNHVPDVVKINGVSTGDTINSMYTVSYAGGTWDWQLGQTRNPSAKYMLTLLLGDQHIIWRDQYAVSDLWSWVFGQTRTPSARSIFKAERFASTPAGVNKVYAGTLTANTIAPNGRTQTFTRDVKGPAWLSVATDGTLSGKPSVADIGLNTWEITVATTDANNNPVTEKAELLIMVEVPGYNTWWQKQKGGTSGVAKLVTGPEGDDDGDGLSNYFEYVTGTDPLLSNSTFNFSIAPVPGNPPQMLITYGPLIKGQTYTIKSTGSLTSGTWTADNTFTPTTAMPTKQVTVSNASSPARFYTVEINKP